MLFKMMPWISLNCLLVALEAALAPELVAVVVPAPLRLTTYAFTKECFWTKKLLPVFEVAKAWLS